MYKWRYQKDQSSVDFVYVFTDVCHKHFKANGFTYERNLWFLEHGTLDGYNND